MQVCGFNQYDYDKMQVFGLNMGLNHRIRNDRMEKPFKVRWYVYNLL